MICAASEVFGFAAKRCWPTLVPRKNTEFAMMCRLPNPDPAQLVSHICDYYSSSRVHDYRKPDCMLTILHINM